MPPSAPESAAQPRSSFVHDPGQALDGWQACDVALQFWDACQHLCAKGRLDLRQIALLHVDAMLQVLGNVLLRELVGQDAVDHVASDRYVKLGEQLGCLARVEEDHLLGDQYEEEC